MRRVVVLPHPEEPTKTVVFTGGDAQSQVIDHGVSAVAFGDLGEFDSRGACCLRGVRRYGVLGSGCWHSISSVCAGFAAVCISVVQITQRFHPNENSRKLKRTGVFTRLPGAVPPSFGAKEP